MVASGKSLDRPERNRLKLAELDGDVRLAVAAAIDECGSLGIKLLITEAYRSPQRQDALYALGRSQPGAVVTQARAGSSWHQFRRAADVVIVRDGELRWEDDGYTVVGAVGKRCGLVWGGDWGWDQYHLEESAAHPISWYRGRYGLAKAAPDELLQR